MLRYAVRRIILLIPILFGMSVLVFLLMRLLPGDPVAVMFGTSTPPESVRQAIRDQLHLNDPIVIQYVKWLANVVTANFGISLITRQPVRDAIFLAIQVTTNLAFAGMLVAVALGVPIGVIAALKKETWVEYAVLTFCFLGISTPSFFLAMLLILIFGQTLGWLPTIGFVSITADPAQWLRHIAMPASALGITAAAAIARMVRASLLEVLRLDYMRTARAKGLRERTLILRHALRNALLPTLTLIGLQLGGLLGGAAIIELEFSLPGLGRTALLGITGRDYPVVQTTVLIAAFVFVIVNLITDLLYAAVDPRVRLSK